MMLFAKLQEQEIEAEYEIYLNAIIIGKLNNNITAAELIDRIVDFKIYRGQWRRILEKDLYLLQIVGDGETFYKIGVTSRGIKDRMIEIDRDLSQYYQNIQIEVLGVWEHRGSVEKYFLHRYRQEQFSIGNLTEYFKFQDIKPLLRDLRRMQSKSLSIIEQQILSDNNFLRGLIALYLTHDIPKQRLITSAERELFGDNIDCDRLVFGEKVRQGMAIAAREGKQLGRPLGLESNRDFLKKPKSQSILKVLKQGLSLREAAKKTNSSVNTVRKVKIIYELSQRKL